MANLKNTTIQNQPFVMPVGNTSERPSAQIAKIRYNSDNQLAEIYNGSDWIATQIIPDSRKSNASLVPLISTGSVDNSTSITERSVFSTNPEFDTGNYSYSSNGVTVNEPGYYEVYATCVFRTSSGERQSSNMSFFINSERQSAVSNSSYMRNTTDDIGGNTLNSIFQLESGDRVGLGFAYASGSGSHELEGGQSSFWIRKLTNSKFSFLNGRGNTNVNDTTSFTSRSFLQYISDDRDIIRGDLNTLGISDYRDDYIDVTESGVYELYAHCKFLQTGLTQDDDGGYRYRVGIRFSINGAALPYISDSSYARNDSDHLDSSTNLKVLQTLNAGDRIRLEFRQETENNSDGVFVLVENESVYAIRKID